MIDQAIGRQAEELKLAEQGVEMFNRDPISSEESQGNSKDDPILVPSWHTSRAVGISHNDSPYIVWFNLDEGKVHYVPQYDKYFKLDNKNPGGRAIAARQRPLERGGGCLDAQDAQDALVVSVSLAAGRLQVRGRGGAGGLARTPRP